MSDRYISVRAMSRRRQTWQEPSGVEHWTRDGQTTLCGLIATGLSLKSFRRCRRCATRLQQEARSKQREADRVEH
jgi:hypothetical protein